MAPIEPDVITWRWKINYEGLSGQHDVLVRVRPDFTEAQAFNSVNILAGLFAALLLDDVVITSLDRFAPNQSFSQPVTFTPIAGQAPGTQAPENFPRFLSFIGRSATGRRVRYYLYEAALSVDSDYRVPVAASPQLQAVRDHLDNPATGICAIDGSDISMKPYVNTGYNAYYQRRRRLVG